MVTFCCDLDRGAARSFRSPWLLVIKPAADPDLIHPTQGEIVSVKRSTHERIFSCTFCRQERAGASASGSGLR